MPVRGALGTLRVPGARQSSGRDDCRREEDTQKEAVLATPAPAVASELMAMWACRVGLEAGGLRMKVVNNFYLQNRPSVKINVSKVVQSPPLHRRSTLSPLPANMLAGRMAPCSD